MRCEQVLPYLAGYAGGDLRPDTTRVVAEHVGGCAACRGEVARLERVRGALVVLAAREVAPPPYLLDALLEQAQERTARRILPIVPVPPADVVRVLQDRKSVV